MSDWTIEVVVDEGDVDEAVAAIEEKLAEIGVLGTVTA